MNKKIEFVARDEWAWKTCLKPIPASENIPQWWKDLTPYEKNHNNPDGNKLIVENYASNASAKKCIPMLDALTTGYLISLWTDVQVKKIENNPIPQITWLVKSRPVFTLHSNAHHTIQAPTGYENIVFKYENVWIPKTPKGYSVLITTPMGHRDLPFYAIPAVIDSDKSTLEVITPMWIKKDFEGIVEKHTPLLQITPFKRDDWKAEYSYYKNGEYDVIEEKNFRTTIINHYSKNHWTRKSYK